MLTDKNLDGT